MLITLSNKKTDGYIIESQSDDFTISYTNLIIDAQFISASNSNYTSLVYISSNNVLNYIFDFSNTVYSKLEIGDVGSVCLLSNINVVDANNISFYTTNINNNYDVKLVNIKFSNGPGPTGYSSSFKIITDLSNIHKWSCLKSTSINNSIFTSFLSIYTYNNSKYYSSKIVDSNFIYCAVSGLNGSVPYMVSAVNNKNTIFYSIVGGACFIEKTKITIFENCKETQKNIEYLKKGDLVKTSFGNYKKISYVGYNKINILKNLSHIMVMDENTLNSNEKLFLTSGHSVLFKNYEYINEHYDHNNYDNNIINCCKIMAQHCKLFKYTTLRDVEHLNKNNFVYYYHIVLENKDLNAQSGIYANNVLCETMSINFIPKSGLIEHNGDKII
jgi:hypothetical protein